MLDDDHETYGRAEGEEGAMVWLGLVDDDEYDGEAREA